MNQRSPLAVLFAIGGVLAALLLTVTILTGGGNEIGALCMFLMVIVAIVGLSVPRSGIILLIFICAYVDMLKRLTVISGSVSQLDVYYVLGIPPALLSAIVVSLLVSYATGHREIEGRYWRLFFIAVGLIMLTAGLSFVTGNRSISGLLPAVANGGLYAMLMFLVPVLYPSREDVELLLKRTILIFIPVALYGVFQKVYGYQDFEIDYLKTGMSMEIKQLEGDDFRPFSTLNSPTALTTISAALAVITFACMFVRKAGSSQTLLPKWLGILVIITMFAGVAASTARSGFAVGGIAFMAWWAFRSKTGTALLYAGLSSLFVSLVIFSKDLMEFLNPLQGWMSGIFGGSVYADQMVRVGTYTDRLVGYYNLMTNPKMWSWFGHGANAGSFGSEFYAHDLLTTSLVTHGLVPVGFVAVVTIFFMVQVHRRLLSVADKDLRSLASAMVSVMITFLLVSILFGNVLSVFPINLILFACGGILMTLFQLDETQTAEAPAEAPVATPLLTSASTTRTPLPSARTPQGKVRHRFTRTGNSEVLPVVPRQ